MASWGFESGLQMLRNAGTGPQWTEAGTASLSVSSLGAELSDHFPMTWNMNGKSSGYERYFILSKM